MRTYRNQFNAGYAVPEEILNLARAGKLTDTSWGNDVSPSFEIKEGVRLWVDHPEPEQREIGGKRFTVSLYEDEQLLGQALETDSITEVLFYLKDQWRITL